jgi:voltage-gated potassium channel Kch
MLIQILIGSTLMLITTIIHAGGMAVGLRWFTMTYAKRFGMASLLTRSLVVGALVLIMFVTTLVEASVWATTYSVLGAITEFEKALYFSTVTYTTLGYGDIVLDDRWRLLSSFEAANGIIMFGWTTALIIVAIQLISKTLRKLDAMDR